MYWNSYVLCESSTVEWVWVAIARIGLMCTVFFVSQSVFGQRGTVRRKFSELETCLSHLHDSGLIETATALFRRAQVFLIKFQDRPNQIVLHCKERICLWNGRFYHLVATQKNSHSFPCLSLYTQRALLWSELPPCQSAFQFFFRCFRWAVLTCLQILSFFVPTWLDVTFGCCSPWWMHVLCQALHLWQNAVSASSHEELP